MLQNKENKLCCIVINDATVVLSFPFLADSGWDCWGSIRSDGAKNSETFFPRGKRKELVRQFAQRSVGASLSSRNGKYNLILTLNFCNLMYSMYTYQQIWHSNRDKNEVNKSKTEQSYILKAIWFVFLPFILCRFPCPLTSLKIHRWSKKRDAFAWNTQRYFRILLANHELEGFEIEVFSHYDADTTKNHAIQKPCW